MNCICRDQPTGTYVGRRKFQTAYNTFAHLGPVVQSIVSLTSSLGGQLVRCFTTLLPNTMIFFVDKMGKSFLHFFDKNIGIFEIFTFEILTKC